MKLNEIRDNKGARTPKTRLGRGIGSGKGKTSARGGKGQTARSGVAIKGFEGGQMPIFRRLPKRGFNNIFALKYAEINLGALQKAVEDGRIDPKQDVTYTSLCAAGLIRKAKDGVKLLGSGELKTKLTLKVAAVSGKAKAQVEALGGSVTIEKVKAAPAEKEGKTAKKSAPAKKAPAKKAKAAPKKDA